MIRGAQFAIGSAAATALSLPAFAYVNTMYSAPTDPSSYGSLVASLNITSTPWDWPVGPNELAQGKKDSVVMGMTLEPPGLDPTNAAAAAIAEVTLDEQNADLLEEELRARARAGRLPAAVVVVAPASAGAPESPEAFMTRVLRLTVEAQVMRLYAWAADHGLVADGSPDTTGFEPTDFGGSGYDETTAAPLKP